MQTPFEGIGKPETLKGNLQDYLVKTNNIRTSIGLQI